MQFTYELGNIEIEMGTLQHQKSAFRKSHELRMTNLNAILASKAEEPTSTKNTEKLNEINNLLDSI